MHYRDPESCFIPDHPKAAFLPVDEGIEADEEWDPQNKFWVHGCYPQVDVEFHISQLGIYMDEVGYRESVPLSLQEWFSGVETVLFIRSSLATRSEISSCLHRYAAEPG